MKKNQWLEVGYSDIQRRAQEENAKIFFGDEAGFQSTDNRGRAYKRRGKTPTIDKSGSRFHCNMVCAVNRQGTLIWMMFLESFTAKVFTEFLSMLLSKEEKKIFLIMDNHGIHRSNNVQKWLKKHEERIGLYFLPPYSPELNPQESVNQDLKSYVGSFQVIRSPEGLVSTVDHRLTELQDEHRGGNFYHGNEVKYASQK